MRYGTFNIHFSGGHYALQAAVDSCPAPEGNAFVNAYTGPPRIPAPLQIMHLRVHFAARGLYIRMAGPAPIVTYGNAGSSFLPVFEVLVFP